jgi:uncharacterized protein
MKYLVIVLVVVALVWLVRAGRRRVDTATRQRAPRGAEPMVTCAHCGLHLPRGEALAAGDEWYCDEAHRVAHARKDASG